MKTDPCYSNVDCSQSKEILILQIVVPPNSQNIKTPFYSDGYVCDMRWKGKIKLGIEEHGTIPLDLLIQPISPLIDHYSLTGIITIKASPSISNKPDVQMDTLFQTKFYFSCSNDRYTPQIKKNLLNYNLYRQSPLILRIYAKSIKFLENTSLYSRQPKDLANGLLNQGTTCYMNSVIQLLFNIPFYRSSIYSFFKENTKFTEMFKHYSIDETFYALIKHEERKVKEHKKSLILGELCKVFYNLQYGIQAVSTKELTDAFGWTEDELLDQHDVHELFYLLTNKIEEEWKHFGANTDKNPNFIFEGETTTLIKGLDVDYTNTRTAPFSSIPVELENSTNLYDSLSAFTSIELLDGENKLNIENQGLSRGQKRELISKLPQVLLFQLKRFKYDPHTFTMIKDYSYFEYPHILDMYPYMYSEDKDITKQESDQKPHHSNKQILYTLIGVLVHVGNIDSGHYYIYIRKSFIYFTDDSLQGDLWVKFDDDVVTEAKSEEVYNKLYGSPDKPKVPTAYILIYANNQYYNKLQTNVGKEELDPAIQTYISEYYQYKYITTLKYNIHRLKKTCGVAYFETLEDQLYGDAPQMHVEVMDKLQFYYDTTIYDDDFQDYISRKANIAPQDQFIMSFIPYQTNSCLIMDSILSSSTDGTQNRKGNKRQKNGISLFTNKNSKIVNKSLDPSISIPYFYIFNSNSKPFDCSNQLFIFLYKIQIQSDSIYFCKCKEIIVKKTDPVSGLSSYIKQLDANSKHGTIHYYCRDLYSTEQFYEVEESYSYELNDLHNGSFLAYFVDSTSSKESTPSLLDLYHQSASLVDITFQPLPSLSTSLQGDLVEENHSKNLIFHHSMLTMDNTIEELYALENEPTDPDVSTTTGFYYSMKTTSTIQDCQQILSTHVSSPSTHVRFFVQQKDGLYKDPFYPPTHEGSEEWRSLAPFCFYPFQQPLHLYYEVLPVPYDTLYEGILLYTYFITESAENYQSMFIPDAQSLLTFYAYLRCRQEPPSQIYLFSLDESKLIRFHSFSHLLYKYCDVNAKDVLFTQILPPFQPQYYLCFLYYISFYDDEVDYIDSIQYKPRLIYLTASMTIQECIEACLNAFHIKFTYDGQKVTSSVHDVYSYKLLLSSDSEEDNFETYLELSPTESALNHQTLSTAIIEWSQYYQYNPDQSPNGYNDCVDGEESQMYSIPTIKLYNRDGIILKDKENQMHL